MPVNQPIRSLTSFEPVASYLRATLLDLDVSELILKLHPELPRQQERRQWIEARRQITKRRLEVCDREYLRGLPEE